MATFYDQQATARERSQWWLVCLWLSLAATTLITGFVATCWLFFPLYQVARFLVPDHDFRPALPGFDHWRAALDRGLTEWAPGWLTFPWEWFASFLVVVTLATAIAMVVSTRTRLRRLHEVGGIGVAASLGAICICRDDYVGTARTQRAVHLVGELAIAARIPPPQLVMLAEEEGVNAFALGWSARDRVVGLTSGAVQHLNREQLQAILAHEFAHIIQGDTRTNMVLLGYLQSLMALTIAAQSLTQQGMHLLVKSISHGGQGVTGLLILAAGVLLWPVGLGGLMAATIIRAAYSRQREYLADAKGVELLRNDAGLVQAMKRILSLDSGSLVHSPRSLALCHAFFANSCHGLLGWLDAHPPLTRRLQRLGDQWDGVPLFEDEHEVGQFGGVFRGTLSIAQGAREHACGRLRCSDSEQTGEPVADHETVFAVQQHASDVRAAIDPALWALTQDLPGAEAMVFAIWSAGTSVSADDDRDLGEVEEVCGASRQVADALREHVGTLDLAERLMLFDAAINQLRSAADAARLGAFVEKANPLLEAQDDGDLLRWSCGRTLLSLLKRARGDRRSTAQHARARELPEACAVVLASLAEANDSPLMGELALRRAANVLQLELSGVESASVTPIHLDQALAQLEAISPSGRRELLHACSTCVESDELLNERETLLMRGICSGLGYAPANLLPGQPVEIS